MRTIEPAERSGAIGEELGISRRDLQRPVVSCQRLGRAIKLDERVAAIAEAIDVVGNKAEQPVGRKNSSASRARPSSRSATPRRLEKNRVVWIQREPLAETDQRALELLERMKSQPQARKPVRAAKIRFLMLPGKTQVPLRASRGGS